ncbi:unnamed protein product [Dovyalis caffra]|uniref:Uncharacterized protein n=1 Tax=Dovyalis caffra TaxID=77055 RepID=A0AAV1QUX2_9ROSI|nr:unnamed protein product [Dovyalis caffra]
MEEPEGVLSFDFEGGLDSGLTNPSASIPAIASDNQGIPTAAIPNTTTTSASTTNTNNNNSNSGAADIQAGRRSFRQTVCRHWLRSLCMKGDACGFLHQYDKSRMPVCRFFRLYGECREQDCVYKHTNEDIKECNMYKLGFCPNGPDCRYRHAKLPGPPPPVEEVVQKIQQLNSYNYGTSNKFFQQRTAGFSQQIEKSPNTIVKPSGTESVNVQQQQQTQAPNLTNGQHQQQPNLLNRLATPLPQGISRLWVQNDWHPPIGLCKGLGPGNWRFKSLENKQRGVKAWNLNSQPTLKLLYVTSKSNVHKDDRTDCVTCNEVGWMGENATWNLVEIMNDYIILGIDIIDRQRIPIFTGQEDIIVWWRIQIHFNKSSIMCLKAMPPLGWLCKLVFDVLRVPFKVNLSSLCAPLAEQGGSIGWDHWKSQWMENTGPPFVVACLPVLHPDLFIESCNRENLELSVQQGVWATQRSNEAKLNEAFDSAENVILIFSVNRTRHFQGCAKMTSKIGASVGGGNWKYAHGTAHYGRNFSVKWLKAATKKV